MSSNRLDEQINPQSAKTLSITRSYVNSGFFFFLYLSLDSLSPCAITFALTGHSVPTPTCPIWPQCLHGRFGHAGLRCPACWHWEHKAVEGGTPATVSRLFLCRDWASLVSCLTCSALAGQDVTTWPTVLQCVHGNCGQAGRRWLGCLQWEHKAVLNSAGGIPIRAMDILSLCLRLESFTACSSTSSLWGQLVPTCPIVSQCLHGRSGHVVRWWFGFLHSEHNAQLLPGILAAAFFSLYLLLASLLFRLTSSALLGQLVPTCPIFSQCLHGRCGQHVLRWAGLLQWAHTLRCGILSMISFVSSTVVADSLIPTLLMEASSPGPSQNRWLLSTELSIVDEIVSTALSSAEEVIADTPTCSFPFLWSSVRLLKLRFRITLADARHMFPWASDFSSHMSMEYWEDTSYVYSWLKNWGTLQKFWFADGYRKQWRYYPKTLWRNTYSKKTKRTHSRCEANKWWRIQPNVLRCCPTKPLWESVLSNPIFVADSKSLYMSNERSYRIRSPWSPCIYQNLSRRGDSLRV